MRAALSFKTSAVKSFLARRIALEQHLPEPARRHRRARGFCEASAISRFVVDNRDALAREAVRQERAQHVALLVITPAHPENARPSLVGQLGVGRRWRNHNNSLFLVELGGCDGGVGTDVAGDERDAAANHPVGDGDGLFGIALIITNLQDKLFAQHAATCVQIPPPPGGRLPASARPGLRAVP